MCNICDCGLHMKVSTSVLSWDFLYCVVKKRSEHILIVSSSWMHQLAELSSPHYQCLLPINMSELCHTQFTRLSLPDSLKFLNAVEKLAEVISPHYHCLSVLEMSKLFHTQFMRLSLLDSQVNPVSNGYQKKYPGEVKVAGIILTLSPSADLSIQNMGTSPACPILSMAWKGSFYSQGKGDLFGR